MPPNGRREGHSGEAQLRQRLEGAWRRNKPGEAPEEAIRRELEEEIGMTAHGKLEELGPRTPAGERQNVFLVRDGAYRAKPSLEIRSVREFALEDLPGDLAPSCRRFLNLARDRLQERG